MAIKNSNNSKKATSLKKGFTLIELLVVISIIGVLSTVAMTSLNGVRAKARDVKRYSDIRAIQRAIELYAADHGGIYFSTGGTLVCLGVPSTEQCWGGAYGNDALNVALAPYLSEIPKDPLYGKRIYGTYTYRSPGSYWLPSPINTKTGSYSISFQSDTFPSTSIGCGGWIWGAFDNPPGGVHCPSGGSCRQCGYLGE